jgi:hypothetical protein
MRGSEENVKMRRKELKYKGVDGVTVSPSGMLLWKR